MDVICRLVAGWFVRWGIGPDAAVTLARRALVVAGIVLLGVVVCAVWTTMTGGKARLVESRLDAGMAGAAASNAVDAVSVVQTRALSEDSIERTVTHAQSAIHAASDVAGADAAGRDGLCGVSAGFCAPARLQQPGSR